MSLGWLDDLVVRDWTICPDFVSEGMVRELFNDARKRFEEGAFQFAGIGKELDRQVRDEIRGDLIHWWDERNLSPVQESILARLHEVMRELNRRFFLGLESMEVHYARYPAGTFYQKHVDAFRRRNRRVFSGVLYLNEEWAPDDGGELLVYPSVDESDPTLSEENWLSRDPIPVETILPRAGCLAAFLSERVPHEVRPTRRERWSVTMWFLRRV